MLIIREALLGRSRFSEFREQLGVASARTSAAVIGPAGAPRSEIGNYYNSNPKQKIVGTLEAIRDRLGKAVEVTYSYGSGYLPGPKTKTGPGSKAALKQAEDVARTADAVILCLGTNRAIEDEGRDRKDLGLPQVQQDLLEAVVRADKLRDNDPVKRASRRALDEIRKSK